MTDTTQNAMDALMALEDGDTGEVEAVQAGDEIPEDDDQASDDEVTDDPEADADGEEEDDGEEPDEAILPPEYLDEAEREAFKALPREAQDIVLRQSEAVKLAVRQVAEERRVMHARLNEQLAATAEKLATVMTEAEQIAAEWENFDWAEAAMQYSPEQLQRLKSQQIAAMQFLERSRREASRAEEVRFQSFLAEQTQQLAAMAPAMAPELVDPKQGPQQRRQAAEFALSIGFTPEDIKHVSAQELIVLHYARIGKEAVERRKGGKPVLTEKSDAKATGKPIRAGTRTAQQPKRQQAEIMQRYKRTGSKADAMRLLQNFD